MDVYEEEEEYYQAFFTREAMQAIAMVTMENIYAFEHDQPLKNEVCNQSRISSGKIISH